MPFFKFFGASNIKMTVTFDNPHSYPGGEMSGRVTVAVTKETAIRALVLKYQIVEHHDHVVGPLLLEVKAGTYAEEKSNETLPILHEREVTLYGDPKVGEITVKPGSYDYDFRIPIPPTAPPTMNEPFLIGVRQSCFCVGCDMSQCNCQCCGMELGQALTLQHRVVAEVVVPRSLDKTSKVQNVPRVLGVYPAHRFPPSLVVKQNEKSYQCDQCRLCPCHTMETKEQADVTIMAPRPYVLLARGTKGQMDVFVQGRVNSSFDVLLVRFAREIEDSARGSQKVYDDRLAGVDDRHLSEFQRVKLFAKHPVPSYRETSQVIASINCGPLDESSQPGKKLTLLYDHTMFSNMCTYIGRGVSVVYGLVLRMDYDGACCGGIDAMREARVPVTVVHDCGYVPENDFNFLPQDPPNCSPEMSATNRPNPTMGMGHQPHHQYPPPQQHPPTHYEQQQQQPHPSQGGYFQTPHPQQQQQHYQGGPPPPPSGGHYGHSPPAAMGQGYTNVQQPQQGGFYGDQSPSPYGGSQGPSWNASGTHPHQPPYHAGAHPQCTPSLPHQGKCQPSESAFCDPDQPKKL